MSVAPIPRWMQPSQSLFSRKKTTNVDLGILTLSIILIIVAMCNQSYMKTQVDNGSNSYNNLTEDGIAMFWVGIILLLVALMYSYYYNGGIYRTIGSFL